jgi:hypothetical protein
MKTLYGNIKLTDDDSTILIEDLAVAYNRRICIERVLKVADGAVTIDLTVLGTMKVFYIHTTGAIVVNNGEEIPVTNDFLLLNAAFSTTFTIANGGTADVTVSIRAYGVVA